MSVQLLFYLILSIYLAVSAWIIFRFVSIEKADNIYESIVRTICRMSLVFDLALGMLLVSLKKISDLLHFSAYETIKVIVTGVFALSIAMSALSYMNYRFLKGLKKR